jgi:muramidase (phage lysozyme)
MNDLRGKINSGLLCTGTYAGNLALWNTLALNSDVDNVAAYALVGFIGSGYLLTKKFLEPSVNWLCNKKPGEKKNVGTSVLAGIVTLAMMNVAGVGCENKAYASIEFRPSRIESKGTSLEDNLSLDDFIDTTSLMVNTENSDLNLGHKNNSSVSNISSEYRALLNTISWAEGNTDYNTLFGGKKFNDFSSHPNQKITKWGYTSSAAGKYQFTHRTFKHLRDKRDLFQDGFTPEAQDEAALYLIKKKVDGALLNAAIKTGNFKRVWDKLSRTWASLPTKQGESYYGQGSKSRVKLKDRFMSFYKD